MVSRKPAACIVYRTRFLEEARAAIPSSESVERPETSMKGVLLGRGRTSMYIEDRMLGLHGFGQYYRECLQDDRVPRAEESGTIRAAHGSLLAPGRKGARSARRALGTHEQRGRACLARRRPLERRFRTTLPVGSADRAGCAARSEARRSAQAGSDLGDGPTGTLAPVPQDPRSRFGHLTAMPGPSSPRQLSGTPSGCSWTPSPGTSRCGNCTPISPRPPRRISFVRRPHTWDGDSMRGSRRCRTSASSRTWCA